MMYRVMESKYTVELSYLAQDENFDIFGFDYDFYEPMFMKNFEQKFIDTYYFYEIGAETVGRWQKMLQARLNLIMPYYRQLYETELACEGINFMLNKDLKETFEREVNKDNNATSTLLSNSSSTENTSSENASDFKESSIDNGEAFLSDTHYSTLNNTKANNKLNSNIDNKGNSEGNSKENSLENEKTTLISQGNIGITSSAELLEKWRSVLINIDKMIIDECRDLFLLVY